ncbi:ribosome-binding factor A [bacterium A37T11]|nr:ribosome-binding factor A [bacterium A37T11]
MSTESKRQLRFAGVVQQDLAEILQREGAEWTPGTLVTVTRVRVTPDLAMARVYLSFLNSKDTKATLSAIKVHGNEIRYKLGGKIKNQTRVVPQLEFFLDDTNEYVARMDRLFEQIGKEPHQED